MTPLTIREADIEGRFVTVTARLSDEGAASRWQAECVKSAFTGVHWVSIHAGSAINVTHQCSVFDCELLTAKDL